MPKLLDDANVRDLLEQADAAASRRDAVALASVYLELGRVVHDQLSRARAAARVAASVPRGTLPQDTLGDLAEPDERPSEVDDEWLTDEVDVIPERPLFDASELDDHTEFPIDHDARVATLDEVRLWARDERSPLGRGDALGDLRGYLALADNPSSSDGLAVEASRLQWATSDLEARLGGLPRDVQVALVGLLAARAQHLQERLGTGVGPSLALDRLRRWQTARGLPTVAGLEPGALPERGGWLEDAAAWWDLFDLQSG